MDYEQETSAETSLSQITGLRYRTSGLSPAEQRHLAWTLFLCGFVIAIFGLLAGFMYGDFYGRQHAQYDNTQLREHYAGQCYQYWENQFKKTVRQSLDKTKDVQQQNARLDEIRTMLMEVQSDIQGMTPIKALPPKPTSSKKKMASTH